MWGRRMRYFVILGVAGLAAVILVLRLVDRQGTVATQAGQAECVALETAPSFTPPLATSDCAVAVFLLPDGRVIIGTRDGLLGVINRGVLTAEQPPRATGPATDVVVTSDPGGDHPAVLFAVDQGIGLFAPEKNAFVPFGPNMNLSAANREEARSMLQDGYINPPGPGRPVFIEGEYVKKGADGTKQGIGFSVVSGGAVCAFYLKPSPLPPGALPPREPNWCTAMSTVYSVPTVTPAPRPPGGCSTNTTLVAAPSHRLVEVVAAAGFQTKTFTINAGQAYSLTLDNQDAGVFHNWVVLDAKTPDGLPICTTPTVGSKQSTLTFTIDKPGRYVIQDSIHPNIQGELVVR